MEPAVDPQGRADTTLDLTADPKLLADLGKPIDHDLVESDQDTRSYRSVLIPTHSLMHRCRLGHCFDRTGSCQSLLVNVVAALLNYQTADSLTGINSLGPLWQQSRWAMGQAMEQIDGEPHQQRVPLL
jgi:hypothetical protein